MRSKKSKLIKKGKTYNLVIGTDDTRKTRDISHFQHQLTTRMQVVESKKYKKPRYKKDYTRDEE